MKRTVTILLSDKRSGSTLFEREMCKHTEIDHIQYTPHTYNETHYWVKAACILPTPATGFSGGKRPGSYGSVSAARTSLIESIQGNVPSFVVPQDDKQLIFRGWDALCDQFGQSVFFEKSPHHAHHWAALELMLQWIVETDYRVRVIGLVRNPMAVVFSAMQLFHTDPRRRQFGWMNCNRNILKVAESLDGEQFKLFRYEDLVTDPVEGFQEVCDFIGVEYQAQIGTSTNADSLHKWRDDPDYDLQLDESIVAFAKDFGYSHADLLNPAKARMGTTKRFKREICRNYNRAQARLYDKLKRLSD